MLRGKKILAVLSELAEDKVKELCKNPFFDGKYEVFHLKGIKNPIAYIKGAWCLETLGEKLSKGFKFTDIDGFLEHYNNILFLEFKTSPHYLKPRQLAALFRLVEKTSATLFVVFGKPCEPRTYFVIDPDNPNGSDLFQTSLSDFQEMIGKWCERNQVSEWDEWAWEQDIKVAETTISRIQGQYGSL